jgi:glucans biosynthesis protein C
MPAPSTTDSRVVERVLPLDRLRLALILLIVLEHATLAYTGVARIDHFEPLRSSWYVVDAAGGGFLEFISKARVPFAIPLLFLISGFFLGTSMRRRDIRSYAERRLWRLGPPLLLIALLFAPMMYAATWSLTWRAIPLSDVIRTLFFERWQIGHGWFLWILLLFNAAALCWRAVHPGSYEAPGQALRKAMQHGRLTVPGLIVALAFIGYGASWMLANHAPSGFWRIVSGPFFFVEPLIVVNALYFVLGVALGQSLNANMLSQAFRGITPHWGIWALIAAFCFAALMLLDGHLLSMGRFYAGPSGTLLLDVLLAPLYCAAISIALLAFFVGRQHRPSRVLDYLSRNSFGLYIFHLPIVVCLQYLLIPASLPGPAKAVITAGGTIAIYLLMIWSWGLMRQERLATTPQHRTANGS